MQNGINSVLRHRVMTILYPLRFEPIYRRYIWGGRRLATVLGKDLAEGNDYAESWEIVDHSDDQSRVAYGSLAGTTLTQLVIEMCDDLLGCHAPQPRFPLLLKLLDANRVLSVQVHPNDAQAARLAPPDLGKTEAWVVLAAEPNSIIYAGLRQGVDLKALQTAIVNGTVEECLHRFFPRVGDCIFLPAGTVHALGASLLIAEIQQSSDTTFRLFDWNRLDAEGRPRSLHIQQALDVIDFDRGVVEPQQPTKTSHPTCSRLVDCDKFILDRHQIEGPVLVGGDNRCHLLLVVAGELTIDGDPSGRPLRPGMTAMLPAAIGQTLLTPTADAVLLDAYLP